MMTGRIPKLFSSLLLSLTLANAGSGPAPGLDPDPSQRFEYSEPQMGVPFKLILYAPDQERADRAAQAAYSRIAALNASLSNYETDSELSRLGYQSGRKGWTPVSLDLFRIIRHGQQMAQLSRGAFDLTIGPLAAAWRRWVACLVQGLRETRRDEAARRFLRIRRMERGCVQFARHCVHRSAQARLQELAARVLRRYMLMRWAETAQKYEPAEARRRVTVLRDVSHRFWRLRSLFHGFASLLNSLELAG